MRFMHYFKWVSFGVGIFSAGVGGYIFKRNPALGILDVFLGAINLMLFFYWLENA